MEARYAAAFLIGLLGAVHCVGMRGGSGAAVMPAFGLGTLPNLLLTGIAVRRLRDFAADRRVRLAAGVLVAGFGVAGLARAADPAERIRQGLLCII